MPHGADRLTLLGQVSAALRGRDIPFALVGAAAMAVHGVSRSTRDIDLLAVAPECLAAPTWRALAASGVDVRIRRGDATDPLAGVVRFTAQGEYPVDLLVGRSPWQAGILGRARETPIEGGAVPVAGRGDLILLKLYAGGPQDAWDIEQLLEGADRAATVREVESSLSALPAACGTLWRRILGTRDG